MKTLTLLLGMCLLALFIGSVSALEVNKSDRAIMRSWSDDGFMDPTQLDAGIRDLYTSAQVDTFCLVWYDFEQMDWQGWTQKDQTAQEDTFFHVDDFSGLGGGAWGGLVPLEGTKSMWCGARDWAHQIPGCPGSFVYLCSWACAPGYGNNWDQMLIARIPFQGLLTFSYHAAFESEPGYDQTAVEYDAGGGNWVQIALYDGGGDTIATHELILAQAETKLRFHFTSNGTWSDEDGLWDRDGAFIVDSIRIADDTGTVYYEGFETYNFCTTDTRPSGGLWYGDVAEPYGIYSGLQAYLEDKDPCNDNMTTQVVFFYGSPYPSSDYPGLFDTPFCKGPGQIEDPCQDEKIISPIINMNMYSSNCDEVQDTPIPPGLIPTLGGAYLRFTVYRDLPLRNLVFYVWHIRSIVSDCPGQWLDRGYLYYGSDQEYIFTTEDVSDLVGMDEDGNGEADPIQIAVGIKDMCDDWYQVYGDCENHTPSAWFDNIRFYRFVKVGPQWSYRMQDLFQDNFPVVDAMESYVRADMAQDLRPKEDPTIDPGDSAVVTCNSPLAGGIGIDTLGGWPMVYMHCYVHYIGDPLNPKPDLFGPDLAGTYGRYVSDDGEWTILQCEPARTGAGISRDKYAVDMNDSLFTRGYQIIYYFKAYDFLGQSTTLPEKAEVPPWPFKDPWLRYWHYTLHWMVDPYWFEWTCLPTLASDVLFVDDFHGRGTIAGNVEHYWIPSFQAVLAEGKPDVYDVNAPSSAVSNGPGSRAKHNHMTTAYHQVIWDSGDLGFCTISEGTSYYSDKSNDCQMLVDWMWFSPDSVGLWVCGDDVAEDLNGSPSACALELMSVYCGVSLVNDSYYDLSGNPSPKVWADENPGNPLWHTTWGDSFYVFGGCPGINNFDVLEKMGSGEYALHYPDVDEVPYYAGIYNTGLNLEGKIYRTMWFGFSFMYIRACEIAAPIMRNQVVKDVVTWMENPVNSDITEVDDVPAVNSLSQNFPNPFNPTTTIRFGLRAKGHVSIKIFDVAGRLVKTLVDEVRDAGRYDVTWDGTNHHRVKVASGVYFYKMITTEFEQTRKVVLLR